ncbi:hypothetical protein D3C81_1999640 [compost metagenome]
MVGLAQAGDFHGGFLCLPLRLFQLLAGFLQLARQFRAFAFQLLDAAVRLVQAGQVIQPFPRQLFAVLRDRSLCFLLQLRCQFFHQGRQMLAQRGG